MKGNQPILITGMHRSGTSATARICNLLGVNLGSEIMQPGLDNECGYWEHDAVVARHEELLHGISMSWDSVAAMPDGWQETLVARNMALRLGSILDKDFSAAGLWGIKDPRLCRLLPLWRTLLAARGCTPWVIMALRNPVEVADSLGRRDGFSRAKSYLLWLRYVLDLEKNSRGLRRCVTTFDSLFNGRRAGFEGIAASLGMEWQVPPAVAEAAIGAFIEGAHRHHQARVDQAPDGPLAELALRVFHALNTVSTLDVPAAVAVFDAYAKELHTHHEAEVTCLLEHPRTMARGLPPLWKAMDAWHRDALDIASGVGVSMGELRQDLSAISADVTDNRSRIADVVRRQSTHDTCIEDMRGALSARIADLDVRLDANHTLLEEYPRRTAAALGKLRYELDAVEKQSAVRLENLSAQISQTSMAIAELDQRISAYITEERERRSLGFWWRRWKNAVQALLFSAPLRGEQLRETDSPLRAGVKYSLDSMKYKNGTLFGFGWVFHTECRITGADIVVQRGGAVERLKCVYGGSREDVYRDWPCDAARSSGFWFTGRPRSHLRFGSRLWLELHFAGPAQGSVLLQLPALNDEKGWSAHLGRWLDRLRRAWALVRRGEGRVLMLQAWRFLQRRLHARGQPSDSADPKALLCEARAAGHKSVLVIDHNLGGGANAYREQLLQARRAASQATTLLTYDLASQAYQVIVTMPDGRLQRAAMESLDEVASLFDGRPLEEIVINNLYTLPGVVETVQWIRTLADKHQAKITVPLHDFMAICPSFTLVNHQGKFCAVPDLAECARCLPVHRGQFTNFVHSRDIKGWREAWSALLDKADQIVCFSNDSAKHLHRAYPRLELGRIIVRPHQLPVHLRRPTLASGRMTVGVIGTLDANKGALIVRDFARLAHERRLPVDIVVIGSVLEPVPDEYRVHVHGAYRKEELPDLLERYRINISLFPSIWPETFSYVCEELMEMGVPVVAFSLGAPAERIARYERGLLVDEISAEAALRGLRKLYAKVYPTSKLDTAPAAGTIQPDTGFGRLEDHP